MSALGRGTEWWKLARNAKLSGTDELCSLDLYLALITDLSVKLTTQGDDKKKGENEGAKEKEMKE